MINLIYDIKNIIESEHVEEKYKEVYDVVSKMIYARELDEKANELNKEINEYLQKDVNKEEK